MKKLLFFVGIAFIVVVGFLSYITVIKPITQRGEPVEIVVEKGASIFSIAQQLEKAEVTPLAKVFYYYVRVFEPNLEVKAGIYRVYLHDSVKRTVENLKTPMPSGVKLTIPEGWNIWAVAKRISEEFTSIDSASFVSLVQDSSFIAEIGLPGETSLEGYLYPETYFFDKLTDEKTIITTMVNQFLAVYKELPMSDRAKKYSMHELVSLASVIEDETQAAHELTRISGVFYNRLEQDITLGADATVRYAVRKFTGPLTKDDLNSSSPYNTRLHLGIPKGPINSPGKGALHAALNPMNTKDIFFVAKWDGTGEHDFSVTNAEHNRKKFKYRRQNSDKANW